MYQRIVLKLLFILFLSSCSSQDNRLEDILMQCAYQAYTDKGIKLKRIISDYEMTLINEGLLIDGQAKSYYTFLRKISQDNRFNHVPNKSLLEQMRKIEQPNKSLIEKCQLEAIKDSSDYNFRKIQMLNNVISEIKTSGNLQPSIVGNQILAVLNEDDFELDYYKLRTLMLFDGLNIDLGVDTKLRTLTGELINHDLTKAFKISIDDKNNIYVNNEKVTIKQLNSRVQTYTAKNRNNSVVLISTKRETMYSAYSNVQNELIDAIQNLRNLKAQEKYSLPLEKLDSKQRTSIEQEFPLEIVETAPE